MTNKRRLIDQGSQDYCIQEFVQYRRAGIIELPITSVVQKQLGQNHCIPDAIISDENGRKLWVEHTSFSRCKEMRQQIGELAKYPEKYSDQKIIPGISPTKFEPLLLGYVNAITQKLIKNYKQFAEIAKIESRGTLVIILVNHDPFFNEDYAEFVESIKAEHLYDGIDFSNNCFDTVVFGAYLPAGINKMQLHFEVILDSTSICRIEGRQKRKLRLLYEPTSV